jgi:hypothetical protein
MSILRNFKSLRDHMDRLVQRNEAREQADAAPPPKQQSFWCHICGYKHTCATCQGMARP